MVRYSDYTLSEINEMIPYEFDIFYSILVKQLQKEKRQKKGGK
jgi:hypothetical protein